MKKKQIFYLLRSLVLLLIFLIISCKKKKAVWYTDWSSPLINDTLTLSHLANDSTLSEVGGFYELNLDRKLIDLDLAKLIEIRDTIISEEFNSNITINLSNDAKKYLSEKGYDKSYGARPLQRLIQKEIKEPISEEILFGKLKNGGTVHIKLKNKKIIFLIKN